MSEESEAEALAQGLGAAARELDGLAVVEAGDDPARRRIVDADDVGQPDEVAHAIAFFCSDAAGFITGEALGVSGGMGCGA